MRPHSRKPMRPPLLPGLSDADAAGRSRLANGDRNRLLPEDRPDDAREKTRALCWSIWVRRGLGTIKRGEAMKACVDPEHPLDRLLAVSLEEMEFVLRGVGGAPWADFLLNPRRLRGSDFLMRWSQGVWSEERLIEAVNATGRYLAIPYGPSGTAPSDDVRAFELYFERLEKAGLGKMKRPDILVFREVEKTVVQGNFGSAERLERTAVHRRR